MAAKDTTIAFKKNVSPTLTPATSEGEGSRSKPVAETRQKNGPIDSGIHLAAAEGSSNSLPKLQLSSSYGGDGSGRGGNGGTPSSLTPTPPTSHAGSVFSENSSGGEPSEVFTHIPQEHRLRWPQGQQSTGLSVQQVEQVKSTGLKSITTEIQLLPDVTLQNGRRMLKLILKLTLEMPSQQAVGKYKHHAKVEAILWDPTAHVTLGRVGRECGFGTGGRSHLRLVEDLAAQERVEASKSKHLELIVRVELSWYDLYQCTFVNIEKSL